MNLIYSTLTYIVRSQSALNPRSKALEAAQAAIEKKATDVIVLEVRELTTIADYMVLCSTGSHRQVQAVMEHINSKLKNKKTRPLSIEGTESSTWILMDYGDIMVHIFTEDTRQHYALDRLWGDAPGQMIEDTSATGTVDQSAR